MMRKDPYLLIDEFGSAHPNALRLAEVISIAVNVEPELLRMARLILVPEANAGDEADLWFSPLVQARNMLGFVFYPEISKILRMRLKSKNWLLDDIWSKVFAHVHKSVSPALFIEEEITWRALKNPNDPEIENILCRIVAAVIKDNNQNGISHWFLRALPNLPDSIHLLEITPMLELGARLRIGDNKNSFHNIKKSMASKPMADWVSEFVAPNVGTAKIGVRFVEAGIEFGDLNLIKRAETLELPATNPLLVEASWNEKSGQGQNKLILLEKNEKFLLHVDADEVKLKTLSGNSYKLQKKEQSLIDYTKSCFIKNCDEYREKNKNILIVGDVMLNHKIEGTAAKYEDVNKHQIILGGGGVYMFSDEPKSLGGAANIAMAFSEISHVTLISVLGLDCEGNTLKKLCKDHNIQFNPIETPGVKTTTKIYLHRMTEASTKKVIRFDIEDVNSMTNYCNNESVQNDIINKIKKYVTKIDCIVIKDHQKGMISKKLVDKISALATDYKIPLYIDPRYAWEKFGSMKIEAILPNIKEVASALYDIKTEESIVLERDLSCKLEDTEYDKLVKNYPNCKNFVIKAARKGAVIMSQSADIYPRVINPLSVNERDFETDVGCGDVFDAFAIVGMLSGYTLEESVLFANFVAGLKTRKSLREHISLDEIKHELEEESFKKYITDNSSVIQKMTTIESEKVANS